jgi:hypothetical protein
LNTSLSIKPTDGDLDNRFRYHKPDAWALKRHEQVTERTLALSKWMRDTLPAGRNLSLVLTLLEDVRMRANAAIACDRPDSPTRAAPEPSTVGGPDEPDPLDENPAAPAPA